MHTRGFESTAEAHGVSGSGRGCGSHGFGIGTHARQVVAHPRLIRTGFEDNHADAPLPELRPRGGRRFGLPEHPEDRAIFEHGIELAPSRFVRRDGRLPEQGAEVELVAAAQVLVDRMRGEQLLADEPAAARGRAAAVRAGARR